MNMHMLICRKCIFWNKTMQRTGNLLKRDYTSTPLSLIACTAPFMLGSSGSIISTSVLHWRSLYIPIRQYLFPSTSTAAGALDLITV